MCLAGGEHSVGGWLDVVLGLLDFLQMVTQTQRIGSSTVVG
jgi:hypothetical protein